MDSTRAHQLLGLADAAALLEQVVEGVERPPHPRALREVVDQGHDLGDAGAALGGLGGGDDEVPRPMVRARESTTVTRPRPRGTWRRSAADCMVADSAAERLMQTTSSPSAPSLRKACLEGAG